MKIAAGLSIALLIVLPPACVFSENTNINIRIGIVDGAAKLNAACDGGFTAADLDTGKKMKYGAFDVYLLSAGKTGIVSRKGMLGRRLLLMPASEKNLMSVNGRKYRGRIEVLCAEGKLTAINEVDMEGYLCGVLPMEISPDWPVEAMKAQAVVSRTYAIANLGKHGKSGYDLSPTSFCQVYGGQTCEKEESNRAVMLTNGEILVYGGKPISSVFHSTCGGHTEDVAKVWQNDAKPEYLRSVKCSFCKESPQYSWARLMEKKEIGARLRKAGYNVDGVRSVRVATRSFPSRRAAFIEVVHDGGKERIQSNKFRMALGADIIKSTLIRIKDAGNTVEFEGRGWGHGVGLCQWGAKGMAEKGYSYDKILGRFFPGTRISIYGKR